MTIHLVVSKQWCKESRFCLVYHPLQSVPTVYRGRKEFANDFLYTCVSGRAEFAKKSYINVVYLYQFSIHSR